MQKKGADIDTLFLHWPREHGGKGIDDERDATNNHDRPSLYLRGIDHPHSAFVNQVDTDNNEGGVIEVGDTATQTLSDGTTITGEVAKYSDSDNKLHLIHVGASDGAFHTFVTTETINVGDSDISVTAVTEDNKISNNEQNTIFQNDATGFLDFSESNPFGDPS